MTVHNKTRHCQIVDCTIRDGGLVNNWDFSVEFVQDLYEALNEAGVEYMEVGYKNSPKLLKGSEDAGPWRFLNDDFLRKVIPEKKKTKLSALVDVGRVDPDDILPRSESMLDLIRVACYARDTEKAIELATMFHERGYETTINIMALSNVMDNELTESLALISDSPIDVVYIVDSYGSLDPDDFRYLVEKFRRSLKHKRLGVHTHNNMQLALANTLTAAEMGVELLDASVYGMGRGQLPYGAAAGQAGEGRIQSASAARHDREAHGHAPRERRVGLSHTIHGDGRAGRASSFGNGMARFLREG